MFRPHQPLATHAAGRVSMPFLPTLAVVAALGIASLYCPSSQPAAPAEPVAMGAPSPTAFAPPAVAEAHPLRLPATLAFAAHYPIASAPVLEASVVPPAHPAAARPAPRLAAATRRPCPGRRCPEAPHGAGPLAAARADGEAADEGAVPARALPFAASVAETFAPVARAVGETADLVRGGAASVTGSVALVAECLR